MSFTKLAGTSIFKTNYIPSGRDHERINLTEDLQLPSNHIGNHNRSFTKEIL